VIGRKVSPEDFRSVRTVGDLVAAIERLQQQGWDSCCRLAPSRRARSFPSTTMSTPWVAWWTPYARR